jgi:hypothetical protein
VNEWITVVVGLGSAAIGAAGGVLAASRGARASRDTRLLQEGHEQRSWVRDQRRDAFQALLTADLQLTALAPVAWQARDGADHLPHEVADQVVQARREVYAAVTGIEITGPDAVAKAAGRLLETASQLIGVWGFDRAASADDRGAALRRHEDARAEFQRAARAALGFDL